MLTEERWLELEDPVRMVMFLQSRRTDRKLQLFACGVCRKLAALVGTVEYLLGLDAAECYADDERAKPAMQRRRQALIHRKNSLSSSDPSGEYTPLFLAAVAISERLPQLPNVPQ